MNDPVDLSALLGSRICHDLVSPLGAIANGVELLLMTGAAASPEVALIAESVANANAQIRFFRVAFGIAGAEQRIGRPEVVSILADMTRGNRLSIDWAVVGDVPRPEVKLAFLMMLCCQTAMPYGGSITLTRHNGRWQVQAQAAKLKPDPALWALLGPAPGVTAPGAAYVHYALLAQEAQRQSRTLTVTQSPTQITLAA